MKSRFLIAALLVGSANFAFAATTACSGTAGAGTAVSTSSNFIQAAFTPTCSNNVQLSWDQDTTHAVACSNSKKGKNNFKGTTNGQAPAVSAACTVTSGACAVTTATAGATDSCS